MTEFDTHMICRRHEQLKANRMTWDSHWSQVARRVLPSQDDFTTKRTPGARRTEYIFDSTAPLGLGRFASAIEGLIAPRKQQWHGLETSDATLNKRHRVKTYFEDVTRIMFKKRYASKASFANQFNSVLQSLGAFGSGALQVLDAYNRSAPIAYKALNLAECYVDVDQHGIVDTVHREFEYTARQCQQKWGDALPDKIAKAVRDGKLDEKFMILHAIGPSRDYDPSRADARGMKIGSWYVLLEGKAPISRGGFHTMPIMFPRYQVSSSEIYGRSVAMDALADIKIVNEMAKTVMRAGHRAVDPPLLLADDGVLTKFNARPGAPNVGGLDDRGVPMVRPLEGGANVPLGFEMMDQSRKAINDAFLVTLFQILVDSPDRMTATEVLERMREKGVLLAPAAGRIENELLAILIDRELDILGRGGFLPEMPPELVEAADEIEIVYDNPLSRAARAEGAMGFLRTVEALTPVATVDPKIYDRTFNFDVAARELAEINGVPPSWLKDPDAAAAEKAAELEAVDVQNAIAAAPIAGKAALDFAKAQEIAGAASL